MPPLLSVVIAITQPWPEIRSCLDSLYAQASELGTDPEIGMVEAHYKQLLREQGEKLVNDDRIVVEHIQSLGLFRAGLTCRYPCRLCDDGSPLPSRERDRVRGQPAELGPCIPLS